MAIEYAEIMPPKQLDRHLKCAWTLSDQSPPEGIQTIYPDGCCELVVHRGPPMFRQDEGGDWSPQNHLLFVAQQRRAVRLRAGDSVDCVGVRLHPAASAALVGRILPTLRDRIVPLESVAPALASSIDADVSVTRLWEILEVALARTNSDQLIESAVQRLQSVDGAMPIESLAKTLGVALRTLQGRFLAAVGLSAKEYARVLRLQAVLRVLDQKEESIAGAAAATGFSDQSHATRELRQLTGLTPARLTRALQGGREDFKTVQLAAAFVRGRTTEF